MSRLVGPRRASSPSFFRDPTPLAERAGAPTPTVVPVSRDTDALELVGVSVMVVVAVLGVLLA